MAYSIEFLKSRTKEELIELMTALPAEAFDQREMTERCSRSILSSFCEGISRHIVDSLRAIKVNVDFVRNNIEELNPARDYINLITDELKVLDRFHDQINSLSLAAGDGGETIDIGAVVKSRPVMNRVSAFAEDGVNMTVIAPQAPVAVRAGQTSAIELVLQLITNSRESIVGDGAITVTLDRGACASLTVEDSGAGIPEELFDSIMNPFFTTKGKRYPGLGLLIAHTIVRSMNGSLGIKSRVGVGTTVQVLLPLAEG